MRAVAVLLVVAYHAGVPLVGGGYVGVDVFFVISGFLITGHLLREVLETGRVRLTRFWARRVRRLLPLALVVVVATVVVARIWGPALEARRSAVDGIWASVFAINYHLAGQGIDYQQAGNAPSPFQHFWSLAVEEQYYLLWPVVVMLVALATRSLRASGRRWVLGLVLVGVAGAGLWQAERLLHSNPQLAYFSLQSRAWELAVGALLAVALPLLTRLPARLAATLGWGGLGAILLAGVLYDDATPFPGVAALLPVLAAAAMIAAGSSTRLPEGRGVVSALRHRPTQFIGAVSYSWYLWHWPVLILDPAVFGTPFGLLENLEALVLALWFATLSFLLVERAALRRALVVWRWLLGAAAMTAAATAAAVVAVLLAPVVQGDGADVAEASAQNLGDLRLALAETSTEDVVPGNLQPSIANADADVPDTSRDGCHLDVLTTTQPACVYGDPDAERTMLLIGDSHAEQWFGALQRIAHRDHWRLISWTKVACPLTDVPIENELLGRTYTECATWRRERLAAAERLQPDLVVASQADSLAPYALDDDVWADGTAATLRDLAADAGNLVFLGDTPRPEDDVPACLSVHLDDAHACDTIATSAASPQSRYGFLRPRAQAVDTALEPVDVTRVATEEWACLDGVCPPIVGRTLVYRDESHLTQSYVRLIAPLLRSAIDDALDQTTPGDER